VVYCTLLAAAEGAHSASFDLSMQMLLFVHAATLLRKNLLRSSPAA
jgi:hypothetical protein